MSAAPRFRTVPEAASYELADEALEFVGSVGIELDVWQADVFRSSLGVREDGKWSAFETGLEVSRQNGKGEILLARQVTGLFLLPEQMLIHSAHLYDTSMEAFHRLEWLIADNPELSKKAKKPSRTHGSEGLELLDGSRIRFRTRTKGGGRGFTADWLGLDEAMDLPEFGYGALLPILSARPNPQVWYMGSAVDQEIHDNGVVFARVRDRGIRGDDPKLVYFEWSLPYERPDEVPPEAYTDPEAWAQANPALDIRILPEHVASEQRALDARTFAVERLGVGDWPDPEGTSHVIDMAHWATLADNDSEPVGGLRFAFDVAPDRKTSSISVAGRRQDGLVHGELVERHPGTGWVAAEVARLTREHKAPNPICDGVGPAASLIPELAELDVKVDTTTTGEMAQACGQFFDLVTGSGLRHLGQTEIESALKAAEQRPLGDAWAWSRKRSTADITPLVSLTLAVHAALTRREKMPMIATVGR